MAYHFQEQDGVLTFTIDRPERRNAINDEVMEGFKKVITYVHNHDTVRFFVITGAGDHAFCSGGDLAEFHSLTTEKQAFGMLSKMAKILYDLATLPVPTIALVNGAAVGGGCEIATACDFRLVASEAKCGFIQGTLAITSGWGGGTYLFERGLRHDRALKMLVDAKAYPAGLLYEIGWAMRVFEGDKEVAIETFIEDMRKVHPSVHKAYKEMELRKWREMGLFDRVMEEVHTCAKLWESDAHHEAVNRFLSKSK
ncbi:enoyl-CoA hydratase/isomerase family protein [Viridibacillus arvi]|uniref:enoyl-CoA hydratase/isomerase family protein n=1 Tax=Viridibacillus arvi TaxID=263475 RepID=UPI00187B7B47|nr:enoyl-CoA hydratase/isomerase family protein [Viridibacillus sp. JNUCC-6]QOV10721.1 enoyl-CoA hydratase/isomerase family protein [Viridibacillus sp. JNUCC-6]